MARTPEPSWTKRPPSAHDIVACFYPASSAAGAPGQKLRPCLVATVFRRGRGGFACRVFYGTSRLKIVERRTRDLIIQEPADLAAVGLVRATRFDLDAAAILPWTDEFFGCWSGHTSPIIGSLTEAYVKEYAYLMMSRRSR